MRGPEAPGAATGSPCCACCLLTGLPLGHGQVSRASASSTVSWRPACSGGFGHCGLLGGWTRAALSHCPAPTHCVRKAGLPAARDPCPYSYRGENEQLESRNPSLVPTRPWLRQRLYHLCTERPPTITKELNPFMMCSTDYATGKATDADRNHGRAAARPRRAQPGGTQPTKDARDAVTRRPSRRESWDTPGCGRGPRCDEACTLRCAQLSKQVFPKATREISRDLIPGPDATTN